MPKNFEITDPMGAMPRTNFRNDRLNAMVEDASGKGYVLKKDTYVGRNSGKVTRILKNKVIIEEKLKDLNKGWQ